MGVDEACEGASVRARDGCGGRKLSDIGVDKCGAFIND